MLPQVLVMRLHLSFWVAMPLAMIVTAVISLLIGFLTLRFKGAYFLSSRSCLLN